MPTPDAVSDTANVSQRDTSGRSAATRVGDTGRSAATPVADTARAIAAMVQRAGARLDSLSLELARDVGEVARSSAAVAEAARASWEDVARRVEGAWTTAREGGRGVPRVTRVVRAGLALAATARWYRLRAAAAGHERLREEDHRALAARARAVCIELRGGVLKLGQVASCRPDLIGPVWAAELASLQDRVPAIDGALIATRVETELGAPIAERFAGFAVEPLAAASLAQVHAAVLADGRRVAVKVQVPGIDEVVRADVAALGILAGSLGDLVPGDLGAIAAELGRALTGELDYRAEAAAGQEVAPVLAGTPLFVPAVVEACSTARVLVTDRIEGTRLTDALDAAAPAERTRILRAMIDGVARQVFRGGVVHADPHPGNFLVTDDGRIAVLDFGCVLRLSLDERRGYARLMLALGTGDAAAAEQELRALGFGGEGAALTEIAAAITAAMRPGVAADEVDWEAQGRAMVTEVAARARAAGVTVPRSFVLLGRVLGTLAGLVAAYRPALELAAVIGPHLLAVLATSERAPEAPATGLAATATGPAAPVPAATDPAPDAG